MMSQPNYFGVRVVVVNIVVVNIVVVVFIIVPVHRG